MFRDTKVWSTNGVEGVYRFLGRAWRFVVGLPSAEGPYPEGSLVTDGEPSLEQLKTLHRCICRVRFLNVKRTILIFWIFLCLECAFVNASECTWWGLLLPNLNNITRHLWTTTFGNVQVTDDIEGMRFNTAIAGMMEFMNAASKVWPADEITHMINFAPRGILKWAKLWEFYVFLKSSIDSLEGLIAKRVNACFINVW